MDNRIFIPIKVLISTAFLYIFPDGWNGLRVVLGTRYGPVALQSLMLSQFGSCSQTVPRGFQAQSLMNNGSQARAKPSQIRIIKLGVDTLPYDNPTCALIPSTHKAHKLI